MGVTTSIQLRPFSVNSTEWQERCYGGEKIMDHPEYYFPDGNIILIVDNTAFNLYRGILQRHSALFEDINESALIIYGNMKAETFAILYQFLFPKEIGVLPAVHAGQTQQWDPVIRGTNDLFIPGIRVYIVKKLAEDKTIVAAKAIDFLAWIQDRDKELEDLLLECIRIVVYRRSPLTHKEAVGLSGSRANLVAVARERIRSLFYNPNYWKAQIPNTLCRAPSRHCSDGVFLAMAKQMSISTKPINPGPGPATEPDLLQIAVDSMCALCSRKYAESVKQNIDLEIKKCLAEEVEASEFCQMA
ncbi:unnamed protein product [Rhizoctonia solani]|uniref:BTB domain-containing protein n=1 Tax=Rhizoctonia solani TaxID=456999 RepID=A0A8H3D1Q6_9AGAM|nr:unnamed protein product [Rhizoctonia solani]